MQYKLCCGAQFVSDMRLIVVCVNVVVNGGGRGGRVSEGMSRGGCRRNVVVAPLCCGGYSGWYGVLSML